MEGGLAVVFKLIFEEVGWKKLSVLMKKIYTKYEQVYVTSVCAVLCVEGGLAVVSLEDGAMDTKVSYVGGSLRPWLRWLFWPSFL